MNYLELCNYLQTKYGKTNGSYFLTPTCATKNIKISRTNEGLVIHHIAENETIDLSKKEYATKHDWHLQESDMLCYCNYIEHLILHIKIVDEYLESKLSSQVESHTEIELLGLGGFTLISTCIRGWFLKEPEPIWMKNCRNRIKNDFEDAILIIGVMEKDSSIAFGYFIENALERRKR